MTETNAAWLITGCSICDNSAIAAVAPVIAAGGDDIAASIAFTAAVTISLIALGVISLVLIRVVDIG